MRLTDSLTPIRQMLVLFASVLLLFTIGGIPQIDLIAEHFWIAAVFAYLNFDAAARLMEYLQK